MTVVWKNFRMDEATENPCDSKLISQGEKEGGVIDWIRERPLGNSWH